jgi:hypothetical protein
MASIIYRHASGGTDKNHEKPQSRKQVAGTRSGPGSSLIRSRCANNSSETFLVIIIIIIMQYSIKIYSFEILLSVSFWVLLQKSGLWRALVNLATEK